MTSGRATAETRATPDGVLLVDKPAGVTSHDAVTVARRAAGVPRAGHAGTLDPFATGLLVVLLGRGTRIVSYIDAEPKVYLATIRFGAETDTDDLTGTVVRHAGLPDGSAVRAAIRQLTGTLDQIPPAYSAKKVAGERAYDAARRGAPLALAAARVEVHEWDVLVQHPDSLEVRIVCSGGTYVRALARDLGRLASSAAHLASLRRVRSGTFGVDDAVPLERIAAGDVTVRPLLHALPTLPVMRLDDRSLQRVLHGNPIAPTAAGDRLALLDDAGELVAIGQRVGDAVQPKVVLRDA